MTDFRQMPHVAETWPRSPWRWLCGLTVCGLCLAIGMASEKKAESPRKVEPAKQGGVVKKTEPAKTDPSQKDDKPPLGTITVLVPKKEFKTEGPSKALRVSFEDLDVEKVLNTKKLTLDLPKLMPEWLKKLDGQRIRMKGYMHPGSSFQATGIKRFIFCRDTGPCCFGPKPTVFYLVEVTLKSGTSTNYIENKEFGVEGVFHIKPEVVEGTEDVERFYFLEDAQMIRR